MSRYLEKVLKPYHGDEQMLPVLRPQTQLARLDSIRARQAKGIGNESYNVGTEGIGAAIVVGIMIAIAALLRKFGGSGGGGGGSSGSTTVAANPQQAKRVWESLAKIMATANVPIYVTDEHGQVKLAKPGAPHAKLMPASDYVWAHVCGTYLNFNAFYRGMDFFKHANSSGAPTIRLDESLDLFSKFIDVVEGAMSGSDPAELKLQVPALEKELDAIEATREASNTYVTELKEILDKPVPDHDLKSWERMTQLSEQLLTESIKLTIKMQSYAAQSDGTRKAIELAERYEKLAKDFEGSVPQGYEAEFRLISRYAVAVGALKASMASVGKMIDYIFAQNSTITERVGVSITTMGAHAHPEKDSDKARLKEAAEDAKAYLEDKRNLMKG